MNAGKHTPGPWTAENLAETINANGGTSSHKYAWQVVGAEGCVSAVARLAMVGAGPATVAANARLIAAAPSMLVALEELLIICISRGQAMGRPAGLADSGPVIDEARAAIAAARGEVSP